MLNARGVFVCRCSRSSCRVVGNKAWREEVCTVHGVGALMGKGDVRDGTSAEPCKQTLAIVTTCCMCMCVQYNGTHAFHARQVESSMSMLTTHVRCARVMFAHCVLFVRYACKNCVRDGEPQCVTHLGHPVNVEHILVLYLVHALEFCSILNCTTIRKRRRRRRQATPKTRSRPQTLGI